MQFESAKLLEDIRVAATDALAMSAGKSYDEYLSNKQLRYAIERCFEIAGEALSQLNKIDPATAQQITDWRAIIGFRNVLIHGYAVVQHDKAWDIVTNEFANVTEGSDCDASVAPRAIASRHDDRVRVLLREPRLQRHGLRV